MAKAQESDDLLLVDDIEVGVLSQAASAMVHAQGKWVLLLLEDVDLGEELPDDVAWHPLDE